MSGCSAISNSSTLVTRPLEWPTEWSGGTFTASINWYCMSSICGDTYTKSNHFHFHFILFSINFAFAIAHIRVLCADKILNAGADQVDCRWRHICFVRFSNIIGHARCLHFCATRTHIDQSHYDQRLQHPTADGHTHCTHERTKSINSSLHTYVHSAAIYFSERTIFIKIMLVSISDIIPWSASKSLHCAYRTSKRHYRNRMTWRMDGSNQNNDFVIHLWRKHPTLACIRLMRIRNRHIWSHWPLRYYSSMFQTDSESAIPINHVHDKPNSSHTYAITVKWRL